MAVKTKIDERRPKGRVIAPIVAYTDEKNTMGCEAAPTGAVWSVNPYRSVADRIETMSQTYDQIHRRNEPLPAYSQSLIDEMFGGW